MNEPRTTLDEHGFAITDGWFLCHAMHWQTREYMSSSDVWIVRSTGLPGDSFADAPGAPVVGFSYVRNQNNQSWDLVVDSRGTTIYEKATRLPSVIFMLGPIPETHTIIPPSSQFDVWDEQLGRWVKDDEQEQSWLIEQALNQRQSLMSEASQEIAVLIDALDPAIIDDPSDEDQVKLTAWKAYRVELSKIDQQPSYPDAINWPLKPQ
jgi:hypothetical protein